jgi:phosphoribosylaminoimidazole carboxylase PurE protein
MAIIKKSAKISSMKTRGVKTQRSKKTTKSKDKNLSPQVAIIMGSSSDFKIMKEAAAALKMFSIPFEMKVISAHRTPIEMSEFASKARANGIRIIIAGAGGAAHLPGMVAAFSELPVIGVPVPLKELKGHDSLLSIVQMPKGVPVATVAIGNAWNAGLLAAQILGAGAAMQDGKLLNSIKKYKSTLRSAVKSMHLPKISSQRPR